MVCVFHPATAVELTVETALQAVEDVEYLWGTLGLSGCLCVPVSVQNEIRRQHSTVAAQKESLLRYWLEIDPMPSWRRMIWAIDKVGANDVADRIRARAEPQTGRSC